MSQALAKVESGAIATGEIQIQAIRQILTQSTPKNEIRERKGRGGKMLKYTDGPFVIRTLNQAFGWDWDFEADNEELIYFNDLPFEVRCRGRLTVRMNGQAVVKSQYGCQPIEFIKNKDGDIIAPTSLGDAFKGAATDALKKCASMLGIALDLYDSDSEVNTGRPAPPPPAPPVKKAEPKQGIVEIVVDEDTPQNKVMDLCRELKMTPRTLRAWLAEDFNIIEPDIKTPAGLVAKLNPEQVEKAIAYLQSITASDIGI